MRKTQQIKNRQQIRNKLSETNVQTKSPVVARIADRSGCQWPSRPSKLNNFFYLIWQGVWQFLLVINIIFGCTSHCYRDIASFSSNFLSFLFDPYFKNVSLAINRWNFACPSIRHMADYSCKRFSVQITLSHNTSVTDDRRTDDNHVFIADVHICLL